MCNNCLPELKLEIKERLKLDPSAYSQCQKEFELLDMAINGEGHDKNYDILREATSEQSFQLRMKKEKKIQKKLQKLKCNLCHKEMKWIYWDDLLDIDSCTSEKTRQKRLRKIELALYLLEQQEKSLL